MTRIPCSGEVDGARAGIARTASFACPPPSTGKASSAVKSRLASRLVGWIPQHVRQLYGGSAERTRQEGGGSGKAAPSEMLTVACEASDATHPWSGKRFNAGLPDRPGHECHLAPRSTNTMSAASGLFTSPSNVRSRLSRSNTRQPVCICRWPGPRCHAHWPYSSGSPTPRLSTDAFQSAVGASHVSYQGTCLACRLT